LLEERAKWPKRIVDVGCGIGGSSRYLAEKFGASSVGITLSPVQARRANALAAAQGLTHKVLISGHLFLLGLFFFYTFFKVLDNFCRVYARVAIIV